MADRIRMGVIGAGRIAQRHFKACAANSDRIEVLCVADPNEQAAAASAKEFGIKDVYSDYHEILRRSDIEAVSICAPTSLHALIAREAFEAGKHVLCEKPAALDASEFREAMAAAKRSGKIFQMGFMERQLKNANTLREVIQSGRIGRPVLARAATINCVLYTNPSFVDARRNGGPFIDMFCHHFDTWSCAFGSRVVSVRANGFSVGAHAEPEFRDRLQAPAIDTGDALLTFESGDMATVTAAWSNPNLPDLKMLKGAFGESFIGPKGFVLGGVRAKMKIVTADGIEETGNEDGDAPHTRQIAAFCDSVRNGKPVVAPAEAGLATLQISLAILKAIQENRVVNVGEI
jgi:myo-inositol 2-dehydrogenase / D-chiro-inositol 1-dehydrogenase